MSASLFLQTVKLKGNERVVKSALNALNGLDFLQGLRCWVEGTGYGDDCVGCFYPVDDDDDFDGVWCYYLDEEVVVSEEEFMDYLAEACQRYIQLNPSKKEKLKQIISQSRLI